MVNKTEKFNYIITGATSGIGMELAKTLDKEENHLILISRSEVKLNDIKNRLNYSNEIWPIDLTNIEQLTSFLAERKIKVKGFVHCAGVESVLPLRLISYKKFDELMRLHLYSFIEIVKFIERNKGVEDEFLTSIVAISSIASQRGGIGQTMYSASKSALESSVRVLSKELAKKGIRLNSIQPGLVNTEMTERWMRKMGIENINELKQLQLNGVAEAKDIVALIIFLLSDSSNHIIGSEIKIDSGGPLNKVF